MTANRAWVRAAARWLARFKTTEGQLRSASMAITAFSTFSILLQNAGLGDYIPGIAVVATATWTAHSYLYSEGGVNNQTQRDIAVLSENWVGPTARIDDEMIARGVLAALKGDGLTEQERAAIKTELDEAYAEYIDGIDLDQ